VSARERHGFGAGADDSGAHDLVRGLGGLSGARGAEVLDRLAHGRQDGPGGFESRRIAARHDGERAFLRALDAAAHRRVDESHGARCQELLGPARRLRADGGAIDDECAGLQARPEAFDDGADIGVGGHADDDRVEHRREIGQ
jgi:hypothetical protein